MMKLSELQKIITDFTTHRYISFSTLRLTREKFEAVCSAALSGRGILSPKLLHRLSEFLLDKKLCFSNPVIRVIDHGKLTLTEKEKEQIIQLFKRYEPEMADKLIEKTIIDVTTFNYSFESGIFKLQSFIDEISATAPAGLDIEFSLDQKIALAKIYIDLRNEATPLPYEIFNPLIQSLDKKLIDIVDYSASKSGFLEKFARLLENPAHIPFVFAVIADLRSYHIDTLDHFSLCFEPDITQAHTKAQALVAMHIAHPSLVQAEDQSVVTRLNDLMRYYEPSAPEAFDDLLIQLRRLNTQLGSMYNKNFAELKFNLFLAEADSTQVSFILHNTDFRLPNFTPMADTDFAIDFSDEPHPFSKLIATYAQKPILTAQVIAALATHLWMDTYSESDDFARYAKQAILESHLYSPALPELIRIFSVNPETSENIPLLKKLFDLNSADPVIELILTIHPWLPDFVEENLERLLGHHKNARELTSAIQAIQKTRLITQTDLDRLLANPSNAILEAMTLGAVFSKEDPSIQTLLENLRTIASLRATSKRVLQPILENLALTFGLSGPFIELVIDPAKQVALKTFFLAHLEQRAPALEITSAVSVSTTPLFTQSDALLAATGGSIVTPM